MMAPRDDVVSSAVSFLQDPSVASSTLDKRVAFLRSKNLTQEEIDISLARAGDGSQSAGMAPPTPQPNQYRPAQQPPPGYGYGYGYGGYPPGGHWVQHPPEPPRRDWRDWFIMATVTTGVGYGLYAVAQRYIMPLISPPTTPQLEQDKAHIDESFNKAFALIDQLATDTADLKASEAARTEKLDTTLSDVDTLLADLKSANARREAESRLLATQVASLKDLVPRSLEQWKQNGDSRLDELAVDIQGLKKLLENRVGRSSTATTNAAAAPSSAQYIAPITSTNPTPPPQHQINRNGIPPTPSSSQSVAAEGGESSSNAPAPGITAPMREGNSPPKRAGGGAGVGGSSSGGAGGSRAAIPAWQMAAANRSSNSSNPTPSHSTMTSGEGASEAGA